jgi:hypothetical protein
MGEEGSFMNRLIGLCLLTLTAPSMISAGGGPKDNPATWTPIKIPGKQQAPEFADTDVWLNSAPLTIAELKGKVVVVHFMAFG